MRIQILFLLLFGQSTFAQNIDTTFLYPFELPISQQKTRDSIKTIWLKTIYLKVTKQNKININDCYQCGAFYVEAEMTIDSFGKLTYDVVMAKKCFVLMPPKIEKALMHYFLQITFPLHCRNIKIKDRLGWLLKC